MPHRVQEKLDDAIVDLGNVHTAVFSVYRIEKTLLRRNPTIKRWAGYHMTNTDKWYFAYTFDGVTMTVVDACHAQNMHEDSEVEEVL